MKLKYININGFGVLVDESAEIKKDDLIAYLHPKHIGSNYTLHRVLNPNHSLEEPAYRVHFDTGYGVIEGCNKIIFAEKELNLDVPILPNWREFEVEQLAKDFSNSVSWQCPISFIAGYNYNKAKYTEEDMRNAINIAERGIIDSSKIGHSIHTPDEIIQSLQKLPKYIVMESEDLNDYDDDEHSGRMPIKRLKLITNSEGKQEGIIKEIVW